MKKISHTKSSGISRQKNKLPHRSAEIRRAIHTCAPSRVSHTVHNSSTLKPHRIGRLHRLSQKQFSTTDEDQFSPHDPEQGIPCNFIELPSTRLQPKVVKPFNVMSFTDNISKTMTFEQMQTQVGQYMENGGRVMKLYPGYEPYMFESIATQCQLRQINPDDLTLILPISAYEIKTGLHAKSHPVHPVFFSKQDKINYIKQNCPHYVPHRRGLFVFKTIHQLSTQIDGVNISKALNLPIEQIYPDLPNSHVDSSIIDDDSSTTTTTFSLDQNEAQSNTTTITIHDINNIDPMDHLATQELPDGHRLKRSSQEHSNSNGGIFLPSGRYPADRLLDKVQQVVSHLSSEAVDFVVLNELEFAHDEHTHHIFELVLESFFQCELLVLDGKTRGYGLSSRLLSAHFHHEHFLSSYKLLLISNFAAELARLYRKIPTRDPYFHPQQVRMLMDVCSGAVLPPNSVIDDMYGAFKTNFASAMTGQQTDASTPSSTHDDLAKQLQEGLHHLQNTQESQDQRDDPSAPESLSSYFSNDLQPIDPLHPVSHKSDQIDVLLPSGKHKRPAKLSISLPFLFQSGPTPDQLLDQDEQSQHTVSLSPETALLQKQLQGIDGQLNVVLDAKRLALLADGSSREQQLMIEQQQHALADAHLLLLEEASVVDQENLDVLYDKSSPYMLIDDNEGEFGKYKDLKLATRLLESKGLDVKAHLENRRLLAAGQQPSQLQLPAGTSSEIAQDDVVVKEFVDDQGNVVKIKQIHTSTTNQQKHDQQATLQEHLTTITQDMSSVYAMDLFQHGNEKEEQPETTTTTARTTTETHVVSSSSTHKQEIVSPEKAFYDHLELSLTPEGIFTSPHETTTTLSTSQSSPTSLAQLDTQRTNHKNIKYYNPYALPSRDKLRSEVLEFQLMTSLQKLFPKDDVRSLVKQATQFYTAAQQEITETAARRIAIAHMDEFFVQALQYQDKFPLSTQQAHQKSGSGKRSSMQRTLFHRHRSPVADEQFQDSPMDQRHPHLHDLYVTVTPGIIRNWELWKKGERKRQFNIEVATALEREYANLFQNVLYKTMTQSPSIIQPSSTHQSNEEVDGETAPAAAAGEKLQLPKLRLGELFKTATFGQIYQLVTGKPMPQQDTTTADSKSGKSDQSMLSEEELKELSEKMTLAYAQLSQEQQAELERLAAYLPLYASTGVLPVFPRQLIQKHHILRESLIQSEIARQKRIQEEYRAEKMKRQQETDAQSNHVAEQEPHDDEIIPDDAQQQQPQQHKQNAQIDIDSQFDRLFKPRFQDILATNGLLTQDRTWYDEAYIPSWLQNKRQSRFLLLEPEVNLTNIHYTTQFTHPVPCTSQQWKQLKTQMESNAHFSPTDVGNGGSGVLNRSSGADPYHLVPSQLSLISAHEFALKHSMLVITQNSFDATVNDKVVRLLDFGQVPRGTQQHLSDYLSHALSFLRSLERSYPYQARDSLAKNLPPVMAVSTAQWLQMSLPMLSTVPDMENALYTRLLPQIQGAVDILAQHEEFKSFASQLAAASEKTKDSAQACIFSYNSTIVNNVQDQLRHLHSSLEIVESISSQLLWLYLGLGFDSIGVPTGSLPQVTTSYIQSILIRKNGGVSPSSVGSNLQTQVLDGDNPNFINNRDVSRLELFQRAEALQILHTAQLQIIPVLKKKLLDLEEHLSASPSARNQEIATATSERPHMLASKIQQYKMIGETVPEKLQKEYELSQMLGDLYNINPFVPAELATDEKFKISSRAQNQLLLLQYDQIHYFDNSRPAKL